MNMGNVFGTTGNAGIGNTQETANIDPKTAEPVKKENTWTCECGQENTGNFCMKCGKQKPEENKKCPKCNADNKAGAKFCSNCGTQL